MESTLFEIFKVRAGGSLRITAVPNLREAKVQMARFAMISPGEYFIQSREKGVVARQCDEWANVI
jgi:hypothetical protein